MTFSFLGGPFAFVIFSNLVGIIMLLSRPNANEFGLREPCYI